jgi:plasmid stability protein
MVATMPGLLIKNVPAPLHGRLKELASRHRRSMTREALVILEEALGQAATREGWPAPYRGPFPLTKSLVDKGRRTGRE